MRHVVGPPSKTHGHSIETMTIRQDSKRALSIKVDERSIDFSGMCVETRVFVKILWWFRILKRKTSGIENVQVQTKEKSSKNINNRRMTQRLATDIENIDFSIEDPTSALPFYVKHIFYGIGIAFANRSWNWQFSRFSLFRVIFTCFLLDLDPRLSLKGVGRFRWKCVIKIGHVQNERHFYLISFHFCRKRYTIVPSLMTHTRHNRSTLLF